MRLDLESFGTALRAGLLTMAYLGAAALGARAQTASDTAPTAAAAPAAPTEHPYTLHVYMDLLQVPTLVLNREGEASTRLQLRDFNLSIDGGPAFKPTALHLEGNDPLNVAVVLDASGGQPRMLAALPFSAGRGLPTSLQPQDRISVYAFDCKIVRVADIDPTQALRMNNAVDSALHAPDLHTPEADEKKCHHHQRLWDAVFIASTELAQHPGRRSLLVLSDGEDRGSKVDWHRMQQLAIQKSVAVFSIENEREATLTARPGYTYQQSLRWLVATTGGLARRAYPEQVGTELDRWINLLRARYIVQFARAANATSGMHNLEVKVSERDDEVHSAGLSSPLRDEALMRDATTVPQDVSKLPVEGRHRPSK